MHVHNITLNYSTLLAKNNPTNVDNRQNNDFKFQKMLVVEKESNSYETTDIWKELSDNYNIRYASFEELCEVAYKLYDAGEITGKELAILTFDLDKAREHLQQRLNIPVADLHLTPANREGKRDWIAEYEARMNRDLQLNNLLGYENKKIIFNLLKRLDKQ